MAKLKGLQPVKISPDVITMKQGEDHVVVISISDDKSFHRITGSVACSAFELLKSNKDPETVFKSLAKKFSKAPMDKLQNDLEAFIKELLKQKILIPR